MNVTILTGSGIWTVKKSRSSISVFAQPIWNVFRTAFSKTLADERGRFLLNRESELSRRVVHPPAVSSNHFGTYFRTAFSRLW